MEDPDGVHEVLPQRASVKSRTKRAGKRPATSARSGLPPSKIRGRGSAAATPPTAMAKVSNVSLSVQQDHVSEEGRSESNSLDMDDSLSVSLPTVEGASGSDEEEVVNVSKSKAQK
ncbi:hypothetical protein BS78_06G070000 [Paspalum vaginatum]|nr:hypothetical protein BS78_06G070000 [Paspalum vaginatum]